MYRRTCPPFIKLIDPQLWTSLGVRHKRTNPRPRTMSTGPLTINISEQLIRIHNTLPPHHMYPVRVGMILAVDVDRFLAMWQHPFPPWCHLRKWGICGWTEKSCTTCQNIVRKDPARGAGCGTRYSNGVSTCKRCMADARDNCDWCRNRVEGVVNVWHNVATADAKWDRVTSPCNACEKVGLSDCTWSRFCYSFWGLRSSHTSQVRVADLGLVDLWSIDL